MCRQVVGRQNQILTVWTWGLRPRGRWLIHGVPRTPRQGITPPIPTALTYHQGHSKEILTCVMATNAAPGALLSLNKRSWALKARGWGSLFETSLYNSPCVTKVNHIRRDWRITTGSKRILTRSEASRAFHIGRCVLHNNLNEGEKTMIRKQEKEK